MLAATSLLAAAALAASGSLQLGLRSEVRGIEGGPPGGGARELVSFEIDPAIAAGLEPGQPLSLELAYLPRILFHGEPGGGFEARSVSAYHVGAASARWRPDDRFRLSLTGSASRGILETSPLAQLSSAARLGQPAPAPPDPSAGVRTGRHQAASLRAALEWRATPTITVGGSGGYSSSGGANDAARQVFPRWEDLSADAHAAVAATAVDRIGAGGSFAQTHLAGVGSAEVLGLRYYWDRRLGPDTSGTLGAGLTAILTGSTLATSIQGAGRLAPQVEAGIAQKAPADRPGLSAIGRVGYAPYVDPYVARVRQRLAARADVDWLAAERLRITAGLTGATVVGAGRLGPGTAAAELAIWSRRPMWEVGVALRGGYQEGDVPGGTNWQWGVALVAGSAMRGSL